MKNKLCKWLDATFNDTYILYYGKLGNCEFNIIEHKVAENSKMWDTLHLIYPEMFREDNNNFTVAEDKFIVYGEDYKVHCELVPFDNHIYHTDLIGGNNGQY